MCLVLFTLREWRSKGSYLAKIRVKRRPEDTIETFKLSASVSVKILDPVVDDQERHKRNSEQRGRIYDQTDGRNRASKRRQKHSEGFGEGVVDRIGIL